MHSGTRYTYTLNIPGSSYADTLTAGSSSALLMGGNDADTYVLNTSSGYDVAQATAAHLNCTTVIMGTGVYENKVRKVSVKGPL